MRPVFSFWAWLALTPYLLVPLGGLADAATPIQWLAAVTTSLVVHLVVLAAFLALGALEVANSGRPWLRWTIVGIGLAGLAFGRPALLSAVQGSLGLDLMPWTHAPARIVLNAIAIGIGAGLTYLLIEAVSRAVDSHARLLTVLGRLEAQTGDVEASADRLSDAFQAEVRAPVLGALRALEDRRLTDFELAGELQRIAHTVVRPLSHQVTQASLDRAIAPGPAPEEVEPAPRPRLPRPRRIAPPPAAVTAAVTALLLLPPVLNLHGPWPGLGLLAIAAAASFLGGLAIRAIRLPRPAPAALLVLLLEEVVLGSVVISALVWPLPPTPLFGYYLVYGIVGTTTVAVALALIRGSLREVAEDQEAIAAAVGRTERAAFDARQRLASLTRDTGRLLHTEIQGDLVATYLQLRLGSAGEDVLPRLIARVDRLLDEATTAGAPESAAAIRDGFRASLDVWSRSLDLSIDLEPAALERISGAADAASVAHDALTEGLTNAVRHSRSDRARVRIGLAPRSDGVEVVVTSPGRIVASDRGIGLRDLDARARDVSLTQEGADVVLRVLV